MPIAFEGVVETFGLFSCTLYALLFVFMVAYLLRVRVTEVLHILIFVNKCAFLTQNIYIFKIFDLKKYYYYKILKQLAYSYT